MRPGGDQATRVGAPDCWREALARPNPLCSLKAQARWRGCHRSGGALTRTTGASRCSRPPAGCASPLGTPAASRRPSRVRSHCSGSGAAHAAPRRVGRLARGSALRALRKHLLQGVERLRSASQAAPPCGAANCTPFSDGPKARSSWRVRGQRGKGVARRRPSRKCEARR